MIDRFLSLKPGELRRLWPFLLLYFALFAGLTVADGVSLALFVQRVGAAYLPAAYAVSAGVSVVLIGGYVLRAERIGSAGVFHIILGLSVAIFLGSWAAIRFYDADAFWFGLLFVTREVSFTLVLLHFGTFLQDYFTRDEMNRVMSIVYAGGRVGGMGGGWVLQHLSAKTDLVNLSLLFVGLGLFCIAGVMWISRATPPVQAPEDEVADVGVRGDADLEFRARTSMKAFLQYVWASPLLFWTTVTSIVFMACRWVLNYQYNTFFHGHFGSAVSMAEFIGKYTQVALAISLVMQLVVVNRLIRWLGLKGAHFTYSLLFAASLVSGLLPTTLALAVFGRFVETELRFGLRNPTYQLISNKFSKPLRVRVRAWTMGFILPLGTLLSSVVLGRLVTLQMPGWISAWGAALAALYLLTCLGLYFSFSEKAGRAPR